MTLVDGGNERFDGNREIERPRFYVFPGVMGEAGWKTVALQKNWPDKRSEKWPSWLGLI